MLRVAYVQRENQEHQPVNNAGTVGRAHDAEGRQAEFAEYERVVDREINDEREYCNAHDARGFSQSGNVVSQSHEPKCRQHAECKRTGIVAYQADDFRVLISELQCGAKKPDRKHDRNRAQRRDDHPLFGGVPDCLHIAFAETLSD